MIRNLTGRPIVYDGSLEYSIDFSAYKSFLENRNMEDLDIYVSPRIKGTTYINGRLSRHNLKEDLLTNDYIGIETIEDLSIMVAKKDLGHPRLPFPNESIKTQILLLLDEDEFLSSACRDAEWFKSVGEKLGEYKCLIENSTPSKVEVSFFSDGMSGKVHEALYKEHKILTLWEKEKNTLTLDFIYCRMNENSIDSGKLAAFVYNVTRGIPLKMDLS